MSSQPECRTENGYIIVPKGLANVIVDETSISGVDPKGERTIYRGYTIEDIGANANFYEAAYLILKGELPCDDEFKEIKKRIDYWRYKTPSKVIDALKLVPPSHPMYYGIYGVSLLGQYYSSEWSFEDDVMYDHALRIIAQLPVLFAAGWHLSRGGRYVEPDPSLDHARDVLRMIIDREPSDLEARAFESTLILYLDHGFNASTFTVRVIASTLSDMYSAVAGGIAALKGPLHGGANEKAIEFLLEVIREADKRGVKPEDYIEEYILAKLARKEKIMGFGHRIYKVKDPRTDVAAEYIKRLRDGEMWIRLIKRAEEVMWREKKIPSNIDLYTGVLYYQLGIPIPMYTPIFAISRVVGWTSHYIEQVKNNKLIRPTEKYVGPTGLKYKPMAERCRR